MHLCEGPKHDTFYLENGFDIFEYMGLLAFHHIVTSCQLLVYTPWINAISATYGLVPCRCKEPVYTGT